jgi:hypothetical protein
LEPKNQEICAGTNTSFTLQAIGEALTYGWQVNSGSGFINLTDGASYHGAGSASLSIISASSSFNSYQYRCIVKGTMVPDTSSG